MIEDLLVRLAENWTWLGAGGVVGYVIRQDRRVTRTETVCAELAKSVKELTERLDRIVGILLEKPWQSN